jgi:hypothetical protein
MATLTTIPLEILLLILRKLDTVDVILLGMVSCRSRRHQLSISMLKSDQTCSNLHKSIQAHHVWLDQTQNHRRRTVALKLSIPSPTTLHTEALKRFAILQAKLRIRRNRLPNQEDREKLQFTAYGTVLLPGRLDLVFLPGGQFVISIDESDSSISLHRIEFTGGHLSLIGLTDLSRGEFDKGEVTWKKMLPAMAPNPVFSYARANRSVGIIGPEPSVSGSQLFCCRWEFSVYLFGISPNGEVNLEMEFSIANWSKLLWVNGQGRIAGFVFQTGTENLVVTVVHLDHPSVTLEIRLPSDCAESVKDPSTPEPQSWNAFEKEEWAPTVEVSWKVCFPTPNLVVICGRDRILAYTLPSFSTLLHGKHSLDEGPTWRLSDIIENNTGARRQKTSVEVFHDPCALDRRYNLHFLRQLDDFDPRTWVELITLSIDPSDSSSSSSGTPTYQRIESRFSVDGLIATGTLHPNIYHSRTLTHSEGIGIWVTSLEDVSFAQARGEVEGRRSLYMFVSNDELEPDLEWESVDLDEASGRVFIWGPTYRWMTPPETRVFLGELV